MTHTRLRLCLITLVCWQIVVAPVLATEPYRPFRVFVKEPLDAVFNRKRPETGQDDAIEQLAKEIDWLEHFIDDWGTVVAKQPDIWGEARLTKHREEYERVMFRELGEFESRINGALSQSDQAYLASALALSAAAGGAPSDASVPALPSFVTGQITVEGETVATGEIIRSDQRGAFSASRFDNFADGAKIGLEPTTHLNQLSRYLGHLHQLRRINEGDDTSDSPGYALNLVRIPVSVLPGKKTRKGYGAEITVTATPYLSDALLANTFRNLVINDLVDQLGLTVTRAVERLPEIELAIEQADKATEEAKLNALKAEKEIDLLNKLQDSTRTPGDTTAEDFLREYDVISEEDLKDPLKRQQAYDALSEEADKARQRAQEQRQRAQERLETEVSKNLGLSVASTSRSRRARHAIPPSQVIEVFGIDELVVIAKRFSTSYNGRNVRWNGGGANEDQRVNLLDVQQFLHAEVEAAYELLAETDHLTAWVDAIEPNAVIGGKVFASKLAQDIRSRHQGNIDQKRDDFLNDVHAHSGQTERAVTTTEVLAWAIVVESALLNEQLTEDIQMTAQSKDCHCYAGPHLKFYLPFSASGPESPYTAEYQEASTSFIEYVRCRWPIHVFALDPVSEEQNIAEVSSRRRELQLALSLKFVGGGMSGNSLTQFARRLEMDLEVISLNRTIVGFSHGDDTFGWRFAPRVQTPPPPSNVGAFFETLVGGPSRKHDISQRVIEPGQRECVAIVLMPSFVPYCDFDVRTNWFRLVNTKDSELEMHQVMKLSRSIKAMQTSSAMCIQCAHLYRDGEVDRLMRRVHQLDRELPLQTMRVQIPYENTLGGFEMFNTGLTDLAPELVGWYGAPGVVITPSTITCTATPCPTPEPIPDPDAADQDAADQDAADQGSAAAEDSAAPEDNGGTTTYEYPPVPPCPGEGTTLFLVGNNLSVHDTRIIAGGVCIPEFRLISRQIAQVTIPECVNTVTIDGEQYVDIHAATPYGVTSHLHIPITVRPAATEAEAQADAQAEAIEQQQRDIENLTSLVTSDQLAMVPTELKGSFAYDETTGDLIPASVVINFDGDEKVKISNTRYQGTAEVLGKPNAARILLQAVKSAAGPISKDVIGILGGGGYTFDPAEDELILERQKVAELIGKLLIDQEAPLSLNGYHNGGKKTLSFPVRLYVQLDEDGRPLKVDNVLTVTLKLREKELTGTTPPASDDTSSVLRLPPVSQGGQRPSRSDLGPRLRSSAELKSTPTLSFR